MESNDNITNSANASVPVSDTNTLYRTEVPEWPISPTFLSLRKGKTKEEITEENANFNTDGIFYTDYLRGFLADLSHDMNVHNALSLFQFVPKDFLPYDPNAENPNEITKDPRKATVIWNDPLDKKIKEILDRQNKKIIRIDSGTYINNGELCDDYRKCRAEHTSFCFMQDSTVGIFADEELNKLQPNSDQYHQKLKELIGELSQDRPEISKIKCETFPKNGKTKRLYVHYTCPKSRFEEHIFPIYIQEQVIACLMFGQVGRDNFDSEESFKEYLEEMKKKDSECPNKLLNIEYVDENQWEKKAKAIVERIEIFEKRLEERIEHRNNRYVNDAFKVIEKQFRWDVKNINIKEEEVFSQFTKALNKAFTAIREKFDKSDDGFIRMFALPISIGHDELVPIAWSGAEFETKDEAKIKTELLKGIENTLDIENKTDRIEEQRRIILEASSQDIRDRYDEVRDFFLPGWLAGNEVAYIVWKRHGNKVRYQRNKKNFKYYRETLKNFYSITQECYSFIRGSKMELLLEATIRESVHESAHFILPAIDIVENQLESIPKDMVLPKMSERNETYKRLLEKYELELFELFNQFRNSSIALSFSSVFQKGLSFSKLKNILKQWVWDSHENIYTKIQDSYKSYFSTYEKYRTEILESLNQLWEINSGSSLIFSKELYIRKKEVEVYFLLNKLSKTLEIQASDSHKKIYYNQSIKYVTADIDVTYFNHALYNLLDNAIKYGHEGSNIFIEMEVDRKKEILTIRVVSYGISIPKEEGNRVYNLFERGFEASKMTRGTGLGMYIVQKVCKAHGGTVTHTSEKLSDYNIPVLFCYKYKDILANKCSVGDISKFEKEISYLTSQKIEQEVVNDHQFIKFARVFSSRINMPTYENVFTITIPLH